MNNLHEDVLHHINLYYDKNKTFYSNNVLKQLINERNEYKHGKFKYCISMYELTCCINDDFQDDTLINIVKEKRNHYANYLKEKKFNLITYFWMLNYRVYLTMYKNLPNIDFFNDKIEKKFDLNLEYITNYYKFNDK